MTREGTGINFPTWQILSGLSSYIVFFMDCLSLDDRAFRIFIRSGCYVPLYLTAYFLLFILTDIL